MEPQQSAGSGPCLPPAKPPSVKVVDYMDQLPDELLLAVFQHLPPEDLLRGAGLVCKRWRRLSQDEKAWRFAELELYRSEYKLRLLLAAPAADSVRITLDQRVERLQGARPRPVRKLDVNQGDRSVSPRGILPGLLRFCKGLQSLTYVGEVLDDFLEALDEAGLTELELAPWNRDEVIPRRQFLGHGLKVLVLHNECNGLAQDLLAAQRESLTCFRAANCCDAATIQAVGRCAQLRRVRVPCNQAFRQLEALQHLEHLTMETFDLNQQRADEVKRQLMGSRLLTRIKSCRVNWDSDKDQPWLLAALQSKCTALGELVVSTYIGHFPAEHFNVIVKFGSVKELTLKNMTIPATFFEAIAEGGALPHLQLLRVELCNGYAGAAEALDRLRLARPHAHVFGVCAVG